MSDWRRCCRDCYGYLFSGGRGPTFACFKCRNVKKGGQEYLGEYYRSVPKCQFCREPMEDMGFRWRPPRKKNIKAWKKLRRTR